ncbi:hypothetical protein M9H77_31977 [Catharanthus roseus]|uniref:Uncharacterized protein n=1 Tax=Catharanthus roseus TaxID=4058 RepID=A0ACC0A1J8_CATRO|nr:hypothetical protein M9H77_31977 [Catharanthus roseus]
MVQPSGRKEGDDLGPVTDRIDRVEGRTSQFHLELRGDNIVPPTSPLLLPILHLVSIMVQMFGAAPQDSSCSTHRYSHAEYGVSSSVPYVLSLADRICEGDIGLEGSRNKRPEVAHEVLAPTQKRKKVKPSGWEQTEPAEGGPIDPELILSYGGHVAGRIWRRQDRGSLKF